MVNNIIIGKPLVAIEDLGITQNETTVFDNERFLPKLLVNHGITFSTNEVRRNRPELVRTLDKPEIFEIKWGKKKVWIIVGE